MTINKAEGQTIPNIGVYLPQDVFSHGQLYPIKRSLYDNNKSIGEIKGFVDKKHYIQRSFEFVVWIA